ncbi:VCBS repeat-containing protein [Dyadobacter sp. CY345]|uniref:FG-GAP repeat domain-containing protein n=1 Tax=Dyadobacter sp. CY345 TaxID=2909335 RepID=UPI001F1815A5|nr:VCBS repeat-containing protein [Dyadobacter sp. CY345]MCF2443010.1 VCBS repeat-containing protein [Dyadobacter sp. CY345]
MRLNIFQNVFCNCLFIIILITFFNCNTRHARPGEYAKPLVKLHCSGCHLAPSPSLLDKTTWVTSVLPAMAEQLGIEVLQGNVYFHTKQARISSSDWQKIVSYYQTLAPEKLEPHHQLSSVNRDISIFDIKKPKRDSSEVSATTLTAINPEDQHIYTSSLNKPALYQWNQKLDKIASEPLETAAVDIAFDKRQKIVTSMGGMRALDNTIGQILIFDRKRDKVTSGQLSDSYIRPIQTRPVDLNSDGLMDYIICSFGHTRGGLFWLRQLTNGKFKNIEIRASAGATQSETGDFNGDGWKDIVTLFAHGDEGIWLFLNDRKGGFTTKNLIRFPPVFGSSSFQLADMNNDGRPDIIYTAGDNSDYSRILKPYHGLYIFLNKGNMRFEQSAFYPVNGCTKAMAADFDLDGDMDIATISFFADFKNKPEQKFLYFENFIDSDKSTQFLKPGTVPVSKDGRWISMDVNDYDNDGDKDIILGNFSKGFMNQPDLAPTWDTHTPFIILENNIKKTIHEIK